MVSDSDARLGHGVGRHIHGEAEPFFLQGLHGAVTVSTGDTVAEQFDQAGAVGILAADPTVIGLRAEHVAERAEHARTRSEEHTSELQSLMRISNAVFCLKKKKQ